MEMKASREIADSVTDRYKHAYMGPIWTCTDESHIKTPIKKKMISTYLFKLTFLSMFNWKIVDGK